MDLDERDGDRRDGVAQRNAGVRVGRRIDDDEADTLAACGVDALDQGALVVALEGLELDARSFRPARQRTVDVGQRRCAIVLRFTCAEQVQVRPMNDQ